MPALYQLSYLALRRGSPYQSISLFRGASHSTCNYSVARDQTKVYDTFWEAAARGQSCNFLNFKYQVMIYNLISKQKGVPSRLTLVALKPMKEKQDGDSLINLHLTIINIFFNKDTGQYW